MITAEKAYTIAENSKNLDIVDRQLDYIFTWIEGQAKLGKYKFSYIAPEEFSDKEIKYIMDLIRRKGFETTYTATSTLKVYTILW